MHVEYAQLPPPEESADRIFITDNAVIVLDGATAFEPVPVSAQTYADHLGHSLHNQLNLDPGIDLRIALSNAINLTTASLDLTPGHSPSSTVAIVREQKDAYDVLVLGDSIALWEIRSSTFDLRDNRISQVASQERYQYKARLRAGFGYDQCHRNLLKRLQQEQRRKRNVNSGYWIAETDPAAANHAYAMCIPRTHLAWIILATDGAFVPLEHHKYDSWAQIANYSATQIERLLARIHTWEQTADPNGQILPRAKPHDDKLLAVARST